MANFRIVVFFALCSAVSCVYNVETTSTRQCNIARLNPRHENILGRSRNLALRGGSAVSNFEEVGRAFVQHYYGIFDSNRAALQNLYQDCSMMSFEGEQIQGAQAITQKLISLPFQTVQHEIITSDSQPSASGGIIVFVCGNLKVDGSENPMKFSQVFSLQPLPNNQGYFCYNDIFRLNYG